MTKKKVYVPWTPQDSEMVRVMYSTTATTAEIGRLVGRTPASVRMRARTLGLTKLPRVRVKGKSTAKPKPPRLAMQVVDPIVRARQFDARMRAMALVGDIPVRNSTSRDVYRPTEYAASTRPGAMDAYRLPSRSAFSGAAT